MQDYLYSVIGFIAIAVQLIINSKVMFFRERSGKRTGRIYRFLMLSILAYYVTDALWGILAGLNWIPLLFADTTVYYVAMCLAIVFYYSYIVEYLGMKDWRGKLFTWFGIGFFVLEICALIVNLFYHCFFWFDEVTDAYVAGPIRYAALWVQIAMFALSSLVTFLDAMKVKGRDRNRHLAIFFFSLIMLVAVVFQEQYALLPFYALGCMLGSCVLHVYVMGDEQEEVSNQLTNYKQAVLADAIISLEANLSRDELYYGVWKDESGKEVALDRILGFSVPCSYDTYIGEWNRRFVGGTDSDSFQNRTDRHFLLEEFGNGKTEVTFDYEANTLSGRHAWLRRSIVMTRNPDGDVIAYSSVKDISATVEQEAREDAYLRALATEYDSISIVEVNNSDKQDDRVLIRGRMTGRFASLIDEETANEEYFSRRLERLLRFVHPDDRERFWAETRRERVMEVCREHRSQVITFRLMKNAEESFYYRLNFIPFADENGTLTKVVSGIKDVDDEVRQEMKARRELEDARYAAEAASRAKTAFLFNMSHDIRTPMNAILGYTDVAIRHRGDEARVDDSLEKIKTAGGHLLNLINDVLEMSRIEADRLEISADPADVRKLIAGVEQMSNSLAISKSIEFLTEIGDIETPYVYTDELHVNEVLINLTSNAVKYTPAGGKVRFRVSQISPVTDGMTVFRFEVADDGIGMSEEFQEHLFEAFSREKTSTVSKQQGAGLGLSIAKRIVDLAGGTIRVTSRQNEGSTFTVELPMRVMEASEIERFEKESRPYGASERIFSFQDKRVLLVEDNEMNREIATAILEEAGLVVETAEDGEFAVRAVEDNGVDFYDFVLMDIQMPVMDGYEATRAIRALPGGDRVTIIAVSANAFEEDVQKSLFMGMNAHVAKPIDVNNLLETMKTLAK